MRKTRMVQRLLLAVAAVAVSASSAAGQVRLFELPDTTVDLSTYTTAEECDAAVDRVQGTVDIHQIQTTHVVPDTLPYDPDKAQQPLPPAVVEAARTCLNAASAHADTAGVGAWKLLAPMYLSAGWDDSARAVVERRLAEVEPDSTDELHRLLMHAAGEVYFRASPPRYEMAEEMVLEHVGKLPNAMERVWLYGELLRFPIMKTGGDLNEDSEAGALGRRLMAQVKAMVDSASRSELQRMVDDGANVTATREELIEQLESRFMLLVGQSFVRDSLRVSTEAYAKAQRELFEQGLGGGPHPLLGKRAPKLEGDVWLGCDQDPCEPYPRPGRVTLVWFEAIDPCLDYRLRTPRLVKTIPCKDRIALRRLQDRFPEVDIVVVANATGRYAYVKDGMTPEGMAPEREAQLTRKWLDTFGLNRAVLTMTETQGWRLPEPDGRWAVRHPSANGKSYNPDPRKRQGLFLVDQDGYVVHAGILNYNHDFHKIIHEQEFVKLIEILLEREGPAT